LKSNCHTITAPLPKISVVNLAVKILLGMVRRKLHKRLGKWCEVSWFDLMWVFSTLHCLVSRAFSFRIWSAGSLLDEKLERNWDAITDIHGI